MYVKSGFRSQNESLLHINYYNMKGLLSNVQDTSWIYGLEYHYKETTLILIQTNNLKSKYKYM